MCTGLSSKCLSATTTHNALATDFFTAAVKMATELERGTSSPAAKRLKTQSQ